MNMRAWLGTGSVVVSLVGCFNPEETSTETEATGTESMTGTTGGEASATMTGASATMTTSPSTSDTGMVDDTGTDAGCPSGTEGCPCNGDTCEGDLSCVLGTCSSCGNGTVEHAEECDGDVEGGTCEACVVSCNEGFGDCDDDPGTGCETDLTATATHCGACGHDCLGGGCSLSSCEPVTIAQSQDQPLGIVTDGQTLFWANVGTGAIVSHSVDPGGPPDLIASGLSFPERAAIDGSKVYWGDFNAARIGRANYDGSQLELDYITSAEYVRRIVTNDTDLFWVELGGTGGLFRSSKVLTSRTQIFGDLASPTGLFLDGDLLYFTVHDAGSIHRVDITDATPQMEDMVFNEPGPYSVIVADGVMYWVAEGTQGNSYQDGVVRSMPVGGGSVTTWADARPRPRELVVDDTHVYWVERDDAGAVQRAELRSGDVEVLVPNIFAAGIAADDVAIYYTAQTAGTVSKLAK